MKQPLDPARITPGQWLAAAALWALALYGLLTPAAREPDVRFAQAPIACACP